VPTLLVDVNLEGHAKILQSRVYSDEWHEFAIATDLTFLFFEDVGLDRSSPDDAVWKFCQSHGYWLHTSNRNEESENSLGATIQQFCTKESLPVLTMADPDRLSRGGVYLGRVVEQLFEYMLDSHNYLGVGRLFLP
jgi:hypothetical protein